jgi:hypothetical protein
VGEFASEFARRAHIDERLASLAVREGLIEESPDFGIQTLRRRAVGSFGEVGHGAGEVAALGDPFFASAIHDLDLGVPVEAESPEGVAGPPVGFVAVEDHGGVVRDAMVFAESGEFFRGDVIADQLVLEIRAPVDVDSSLDVAHVVEEDVFVAFDESEARVGEVLGDPFGGDEHFGVGVIFIDHGLEWGKVTPSRAAAKRQDADRGLQGGGQGLRCTPLNL